DRSDCNASSSNHRPGGAIAGDEYVSLFQESGNGTSTIEHQRTAKTTPNYGVRQERKRTSARRSIASSHHQRAITCAGLWQAHAGVEGPRNALRLVGLPV